MSLYEDLGLSPDATPDEIKAAHRRAARKHHPDTGGDPEEFQRIQRAALILRDPEKRERYDRTGECDNEPDNSAGVPVSLMLNAFSRVIDSGVDLRFTNVAEEARAVLLNEMEALKAQRSKVKAACDRSAQALKRISRKGSGTNYVAVMLSNSISDHEKMLSQMDERKGFLQQAIDMVSDFKWKVDKKPAQQPMQWSATSGTTTAGWR